MWEEPGVAKVLNQFETCFVSNNPPPKNRCWSRSHGDGGDIFYIKTDDIDHNYIMHNREHIFTRCDPMGYNDGATGYDLAC